MRPFRIQARRRTSSHLISNIQFGSENGLSSSVASIGRAEAGVSSKHYLRRYSESDLAFIANWGLNALFVGGILAFAFDVRSLPAFKAALRSAV